MTTAGSPDRDPADGGDRRRPPGPPDAGSEGGGPARVVLVPGEKPTGRRSRWVRRLLAVLALAVAGAVAYGAAGGDALEPYLPFASAAGAGGGERAAAASDTAGPSPGSSDGAARRPAPADPRLREYRRLAGELSSAVRRFRERSEDYRLDRLGCRGLARGYEAVDRAMVDLARAYVEVRERLDPDGGALYERSMAMADSAGRSFDATGCERVP